MERKRRCTASAHSSASVGAAEKVTSGSPAPYLKKNIGLAYVPVEYAKEGQEIQIDVRGRAVGARIVPTPFYKRKKE